MVESRSRVRLFMRVCGRIQSEYFSGVFMVLCSSWFKEIHRRSGQNCGQLRLRYTKHPSLYAMWSTISVGTLTAMEYLAT